MCVCVIASAPVVLPGLDFNLVSVDLIKELGRGEGLVYVARSYNGILAPRRWISRFLGSELFRRQFVLGYLTPRALELGVPRRIEILM